MKDRVNSFKCLPVHNGANLVRMSTELNVIAASVHCKSQQISEGIV
jgi:hypothetical protein